MEDLLHYVIPHVCMSRLFTAREGVENQYLFKDGRWLPVSLFLRCEEKRENKLRLHLGGYSGSSQSWPVSFPEVRINS